jgi:hypothetical protein
MAKLRKFDEIGSISVTARTSYGQPTRRPYARLEPSRGPVKTIVIEHAEKPLSN